MKKALRGCRPRFSSPGRHAAMPANHTRQLAFFVTHRMKPIRAVIEAGSRCDRYLVLPRSKRFILNINLGGTLLSKTIQAPIKACLRPDRFRVTILSKPCYAPTGVRSFTVVICARLPGLCLISPIVNKLCTLETVCSSDRCQVCVRLNQNVHRE
jgi:hypothetical protein